MATNTDDLVRQLVEAIERMRSSSIVYANSVDRSTSATSKAASGAVNISASLENLKARYTIAGNQASVLAQQFNELRQNVAAYGNRAQQAEQLRKINDAQVKLAKDNFISGMFNMDNATAIFRNTLAAVTSSMGGFIRSLQGGGSATEMTSGILTSGLSLISTGLTSGGKNLTNFGAALFAVQNPMAKLAGALTYAAGGLLRFGGLLAQGVSFALDILSKELEKTNTAFITMANAGALYTDGLAGMRKAAHDSGLTLVQFSNVIKTTGPILADLGIGVREASQRMSGALRAGGDDMKMRLLNLGFSFEEQAVLAAEVMRDLRQSGGPLQASNEVVAQQTEKYAQNLRIIASSTGEDAKKRMESARQAVSQLAFQQKLAGMDEVQRQNTIMAMANMSELQQRNFMDTVNFGSVINREGAAAAAMSQGLTDSVNSYADQFARGQLTPESVREQNKQLGEQTKQEILNLREIGLAGAAGVGGIVSELAKILGGELAFRNKTTRESLEDAEKSARAQAESRDKLTENFRQATTAAQKFAGEFERIATDLLPGYSNLLLQTMGILANTLGQTPQLEGFATAFKQIQTSMLRSNPAVVLESLGLDPERKQRISDLLKGDETARQRGIDLINQEIEQRRRNIGAAPAAATEPSAAGAASEPLTIRTQDGQPLPVTIVDPIPQGAGGGLISGPKSGYFAVLHGNEIVIPEGGKVPVKSNESETPGRIPVGPDVMAALLTALDEQSRKFGRLLEINQEMLSSIDKQSDISSEMLKNAYS